MVVVVRHMVVVMGNVLEVRLTVVVWVASFLLVGAVVMNDWSVVHVDVLVMDDDGGSVVSVVVSVMVDSLVMDWSGVMGVVMGGLVVHWSGVMGVVMDSLVVHRSSVVSVVVDSLVVHWSGVVSVVMSGLVMNWGCMVSVLMSGFVVHCSGVMILSNVMFIVVDGLLMMDDLMVLGVMTNVTIIVVHLENKASILNIDLAAHEERGIVFEAPVVACVPLLGIPMVEVVSPAQLEIFLVLIVIVNLDEVVLGVPWHSLVIKVVVPW